MLTSPTHPKSRPRLWRGVHLDWRAALPAGLAAGTAFLMLELVTHALFGAGSPFGPAHVTLHGLLGAEGAPHQYDLGPVLVGLLLHFNLSVVVILPLAVFIHPWKKRYLAAAVGFLYGYTLYFINFNLFAVAIPLLAGARDWFMLLDYALFGTMGAWFYVALRDRVAAQAN